MKSHPLVVPAVERAESPLVLLGRDAALHALAMPVWSVSETTDVVEGECGWCGRDRVQVLRMASPGLLFVLAHALAEPAILEWTALVVLQGWCLPRLACTGTGTGSPTLAAGSVDTEVPPDGEDRCEHRRGVVRGGRGTAAIGAGGAALTVSAARQTLHRTHLEVGFARQRQDVAATLWALNARHAADDSTEVG